MNTNTASPIKFNIASDAVFSKFSRKGAPDYRYLVVGLRPAWYSRLWAWLLSPIGS